MCTCDEPPCRGTCVSLKQQMDSLTASQANRHACTVLWCNSCVCVLWCAAICLWSLCHAGQALVSGEGTTTAGQHYLPQSEGDVTLQGFQLKHAHIHGSRRFRDPVFFVILMNKNKYNWCPHLNFPQPTTRGINSKIRKPHSGIVDLFNCSACRSLCYKIIFLSMHIQIASAAQGERNASPVIVA